MAYRTLTESIKLCIHISGRLSSKYFKQCLWSSVLLSLITGYILSDLLTAPTVTKREGQKSSFCRAACLFSCNKSRHVAHGPHNALQVNSCIYSFWFGLYSINNVGNILTSHCCLIHAKSARTHSLTC